MKKYLKVTNKHIIEKNNQYVMKEPVSKTGTCIDIITARSGAILYIIDFGEFKKSYSKAQFKKTVVGYIPKPINNKRCFFADVGIDGKELHGLIVGYNFYYGNKVVILRKGLCKILCEYEEDEPISFATPKLKKIYKENVQKNV